MGWAAISEFPPRDNIGNYYFIILLLFCLQLSEKTMLHIKLIIWGPPKIILGPLWGLDPQIDKCYESQAFAWLQCVLGAVSHALHSKQ